MGKIDFSDRIGKALFSGARYIGIYGSRGSGKSWAVALWLVFEACKRRVRIVCVRQYQKSIADSSKELIEKWIRKLGLDAEFHITHTSIAHKFTGAEFLFVGLQVNPDNIRGLEDAGIVWVDEAQSLSRRGLDALLPTVRAPGSQLIFSWNPTQPDDPVDEFFRGKNPPEDMVLVEQNAIHNPWFEESPMAAEKARAERDDPIKAAHIWGGQYDVSFETRVFRTPERGRPADVDLPNAQGPYYAVDFGYTDHPCAIVKLFIIPRPEPLRDILYIAQEIYRYGVELRDYPAMLDEIVHKREARIVADSAEPKTIAALEYVGFTQIVGMKKSGVDGETVKEGIRRLNSYDIIIDPNCPNAFDEFRGARWPTDPLTGKVKSKENPKGEDHLLDCCRYATFGANPLASGGGNGGKRRRGDGGVFRLRLW